MTSPRTTATTTGALHRWRERYAAQDQDAGIAMVLAVAIIVFATLAVATLVTVAIAENGMSGRERQRAVSIASAEGQVDHLVSRIHYAPLSTLQEGVLCGAITPFVTDVGPDELTIDSRITFYDAAGAVVACSAVRTGAVEAATAAVRATSTSTPVAQQAPAVRTFETVVRLKLQTDLNKAVFGNSSVVINNSLTVIAGSAGSQNGDVYSNGNLSCKGYVYGSIYSQGTTTLEHDCRYVAGNVMSVGNVLVQPNDKTVMGDITSSAGSIALNNLGTSSGRVLNGKARAWGTVTGDVCSAAAVLDKCHGYQVVDAPPGAPFPQLLGDSSWTSPVSAGGAGYTQVTFPSCDAGYDQSGSLARWLVTHGTTLTAPVLIRMPASCVVNFSNMSGHEIVLAQDVAIWAASGFSINGQPTFSGLSGSTKNLYLMQDYATPSCSRTGIEINNGLIARTNIRVLMYTPHKFYSPSGTSMINGQIYAGCAVEMNNSMNLTYDSLPVWGVQNKDALSYKVEIVAKRETA
ncbi:hypothetical protein [Cellulomonas soli]|uniref:Uncharacterized protein n=1 Tax=Cellulomonas soli TaxID=931535 RepID=A0A512PA78_9CELL|nr:hypothetical protein [Cellulomonas soli]NYI60602.1 hypothetical protein [Cellulomonas soli]GEP68117.1 hypothetical protein CSO01_08320 [Cellulomonas soli]